MQDYILVMPILAPIFTGIILLLLQSRLKQNEIHIYGMTAITITVCLVVLNVILGERKVILLYLVKDIPLYFKLDDLGKVFSIVISILWVLAGIFGITYMKKQGRQAQYFGFYLIELGVLLAASYAGNLVTFYVFFECLTLASTPLVLHTRTREAKMAALKYLFYSVCGAYMILYGMYFMYNAGISLTFLPGQAISRSVLMKNEHMTLLAAFLMIVGFSVKAGMAPFHAWLWAAHPVAPAPASAVLSAVITKIGVLGILRVIYFIVGSHTIAETWVQWVILGCCIVTILMGSMLAYREDILKKRFAYSTISQVSYILFGIFLLVPTSTVGSMLHVVAHAFIKGTLFLVAGAIIHLTHKTRVSELVGIGKQLPVVMVCYTIAALGLIGIPPTSGFISKWYLAIGGLEAKVPFWSMAGVIALIISALLTAGYLLPITIKGFFPGAEYTCEDEIELHKDYGMTIPIVVLTVLSLAVGLFPNQLTDYFIQIIEKMI